MRILAVRGRNLASLAAFEKMLYGEALRRCSGGRKTLSELSSGEKLADRLPHDVRIIRDGLGESLDDLGVAMRILAVRGRNLASLERFEVEFESGFEALLDGVAQAESQ